MSDPDFLKPGFINSNGQLTVRSTGIDPSKAVYELACSHCGFFYRANGTEVGDRRCPQCQGGASGLPLEERRQKWPNHLVIVRHGQSERNVAKEHAKAEGLVEAFSNVRDIDTALTPVGIQQAISTGDFLKDKINFDVIFSSPYLRAIQTAEHITSRFDTKPPVLLEERIREIEFGMLDGFTWQGVRERFPEEWARRKREGKYWYRPPGGESRPDVALRVHSFLGALTRDYRQKNVLVICHSVVVLIFRRLLERWDEAKYMEVDRENDVLNCGVTAYRYDPAAHKLVLDYYNSICYPVEKNGPATP
jgi:2,3-bisphosphoglycerate-dependent phosphoglycerate mutase